MPPRTPPRMPPDLSTAMARTQRETFSRWLASGARRIGQIVLQPGPDGSAAALPQMMMMPQAGLQGVPGQPAGQQMPFMMPPGAMLYPGAMLPQVLPAHTGPSEPGTAASLLPDARHASAADVNGRPAAASSRLQIKQCN